MMYFSAARLIEKLRSSFWFTPGLLGVIGILLAMATVALDRSGVGEGALSRVLPLGNVEAEGVRAVISTIAGGMMTVTSLVFSLTFVALTTLSGQLGPRILLFFMRDRATKVSMGIFIATFLFALIALASSGTVEGTAHITFITALFLAIISLGTVIYFVDHVARSMQADVVVAALGARLEEAIDRSIREEADDSDPTEEDITAFDGRFSSAPQTLHAARGGYLVSIDYEGLLAVAHECDAFISLEHRVNCFVFEGTVLARFVVDEARRDTLRGQIETRLALDTCRAPSQHASFELTALTEVALRALSPGINDPYTAGACIERLGNALARMTQGAPLPEAMRDAEGTVRLSRPLQDFPACLNISFAPIIAASGGSPVAIDALIRSLTHLDSKAKRSQDRKAIAAMANAVDALIAETIADNLNTEVLRARLQEIGV